MKQTKLKLIDGGAREPSPPPPPEPKGTSSWEYAVLGTVAGAIWLTMAYWIWKWFFR